MKQTFTSMRRECALVTHSGLQYACIIESGASSHMSGCRKLFDTFRTTDGDVSLGDNSRRKIGGIGNIPIDNLKLTNVLFVPGLKVNLISVETKLTKENYTCVLRNSRSSIQFSRKVARIVHDLRDNLYYLRSSETALLVQDTKGEAVRREADEKLHSVLDHPCKKVMKQMPDLYNELMWLITVRFVSLERQFSLISDRD
jgi:hypothetical protein